MGQVLVTYGKVDNRRAVPVWAPYGASSEEKTTSGTAGSTTAVASLGDYVRISNNSSTLVWAAIGQSPTAAVGTTFAVLPNTSIDLGPLAAGDKVSVIDDS
jgi:hypothetical protein